MLKVDKVRKQFGGLVAVNDISFQIDAGQIVGLIGPNGAGKSTTFNLITGVLCPRPAAQVLFRGQRHQRPALARDRAPGHGAHLPARQDDSRHDGAGERGLGAYTARTQRRASAPCCAWTAPRNSA